MSESTVVWGKTLAATGGTVGFLLSVFYWFNGSVQLSLQEILFAASLTFGCLLGVFGTLVPKIENMARGVIILGASLLVLRVWLEFLGPISASSLLLLQFSWVAMMVVGGTLVVLSPNRQRRGNNR